MVKRVAVPTAWALEDGVTFSQSPDVARVVRNSLRMYPIEPLTEPVVGDGARRVAEADRHADGTAGISIEHALIRAVGIARNEPVLTRNTDDFRSLGVTVESY